MPTPISPLLVPIVQAITAVEGEVEIPTLANGRPCSYVKITPSVAGPHTIGINVSGAVLTLPVTVPPSTNPFEIDLRHLYQGKIGADDPRLIYALLIDATVDTTFTIEGHA